MVCFVEHKSLHAGGVENLRERADLAVLFVARQRLIGHDRQEARRGEIGGDPVGCGRFAPEGIQEAADPLIADRDRRCKNQCGLAHAAQRFEADDRLSGARRRDQVKVIVLEMSVEFRQYPRLVGTPGVAELDAIGEATAHSHSMVAGGFPEMSYTTREMPFTSLTMRREHTSRKSYGNRAQCAVMKSMVSTARRLTT